MEASGFLNGYDENFTPKPVVASKKRPSDMRPTEFGPVPLTDEMGIKKHQDDFAVPFIFDQNVMPIVQQFPDVRVYTPNNRADIEDQISTITYESHKPSRKREWGEQAQGEDDNALGDIVERLERIAVTTKKWLFARQGTSDQIS